MHKAARSWGAILIAATLAACGTANLAEGDRSAAAAVGFFTHDAEVELLQIQTLVDSGFERIAIPWNAPDPADRQAFYPFIGTFFAVQGDDLFASRPLLYAWLSALLYVLFGIFGLHLLPAAALAGTAWAGARILARLGPAAPARSWALPYGLALALGTPALFYGLTCWNMMVAPCALTGAVALLLAQPLRLGRSIAAGAVLALGMGIRPELWLAAPIVLCWIGALRGARAAAGVVGGLAGPLAVLLGLNLLVFGELLGPHVAGNQVAIADWLVTRPQVAQWLLGAATGPQALLWLAAGGAVLALAPGKAGWLPGWLRQVGLGALVGCCATFTVVLFVRADPLKLLLHSHSLLGACPALLLACYFPAAEDRTLRSLRWLTLALVAVLVIACPPQTAKAAHWGPRVLLGAVPLLLVCAFFSGRAFLRAHPGRLSWALLLALGLLTVADQAFSLRALRFKSGEAAALKAQVARTGDGPIVTDHLFIPLELASQYDRRGLWLVEDPAAAPRVLRLLRARGADRFVALGSPRSPVQAAFAAQAQEGRIVEEARRPLSTRLYYLRGLDLVTYRLPPPAAGPP